jgi:fucose permease
MTSPLNNDESSPLLTRHTNANETSGNAQQRIFNKLNMSLWLQIAAAMVSFSTLGLFNSSIGAVLPLISQHYSLTDLHVSLLFLAGPLGYIGAALYSDTIHHRFGQRGIALVGPVLQIIATALIALHPRFGWVLCAFAVQGLGTGLLDGSWCAWAGSMEKANTISGMLHGSYSVGGAAGPFLVTLITTKGYPWYLWYSVLVRISHLFLYMQLLS